MRPHTLTDRKAVRSILQRAAARGSRQDDGFAMLSVILLIMICAGLSILMLGVVVAQVKPTVFAAKNTRTIAAAEAGVDATLSQLRTATTADLSGAVFGDPHKLPCTVNGKVGGASATLSYSVAVSYYVASPAAMTPFERSSLAVGCIPGSGVPYAPGFAVITAIGQDSAVGGYAASIGDRTLETIYTFQVTNVNVDGGIMYNWGRTACLRANSIAIGAAVNYIAATACTDDSQNLWSYKKDYTIRLAATDFAGSTAPLCMTGRNTALTLRLCKTGTAMWDQEFAWQAGARFTVLDADGTKASTYCLSAGSAVPDPIGLPAQVSWCGNNQPAGSFDPDPRVGAGKASAATHQLVSFLEFGRCFDVTDMDPSKVYMILYPCKQAPGSAETLAWNHQWWYNEPAGSVGITGSQNVYVYQDYLHTATNTYCLRSPLVNGGRVTLVRCDSGLSGLDWKRAADMPAYADSWVLKDSSGLCAGVGPKGDLDYTQAWSTIVVGTCTGGSEQKWNAPSNSQAATLNGYRELN